MTAKQHRCFDCGALTLTQRELDHEDEQHHTKAYVCEKHPDARVVEWPATLDAACNVIRHLRFSRTWLEVRKEVEALGNDGNRNRALEAMTLMKRWGGDLPERKYSVPDRGFNPLFEDGPR